MDTSDESPLANWSVDIDQRAEDVNMVSQEELFWKKASIYKVPAHKRKLYHREFTPMFVSFGPFHYDNLELKRMKVHKERALVHFLKKTHQSFQNIKREVAKSIVELQDAYYCLDDRWKKKDEKFLKMMILDGCFMLEILQRLEVLDQECISNERDYSNSDPYFSLHAVFHNWWYIRRDMLLIENQLPLLLVKTLVKFTLKPEDPRDINHYTNRLVLNLVGCKGIKTTLGLHALDLYRHSLINSEPDQRQQTEYEPPHNQWVPFDTVPIPCAIELHNIGVIFRESNTINIKGISFNATTGNFHLPCLIVDDATECLLLNAITFEYLHVNTAPDVTNYVNVMDEIIQSADDVHLLHKKGLICVPSRHAEKVAGIFSRISNEATMFDDKYLSEVRKDVLYYCKRRRNRLRAHLIKTYYRNPNWTIISLSGALLIIALTLAQTIYASRQN